jgi:hypothetical protein
VVKLLIDATPAVINLEPTMSTTRTFKITHRVNTSERTVSVEARDADGAQEKFIDYCESVGLVHGTILSIRAA